MAEDVPLWRVRAGTYKPSFSTTATRDQIRQVGIQMHWYKAVWFRGATPKYSFVLWLATINRLTTGDRMLGWNQGINPVCVLCQQSIETRDHLFFHCCFSGSIWATLVRNLLQSRYAATFSDIQHLLSGSTCDQSLRFVMRYVFQATVYIIWQERNKRRHGEIPRTSALLCSTIDRIVRNRIVSFNSLYPATYPDAYSIWIGAQ